MSNSDSEYRNKSKRWNLFRSPQQKDLFDFGDIQDKLLSGVEKEQEGKDNKNNKNQDVKEIQTKLFQNQENKIKQQSDQINQFQSSNLTFATRYHQQDDNKLQTQRNNNSSPKNYFKSKRIKNIKSIQSQQDKKQEPLFTQGLKNQDSLQKIFIREIQKTEQNQYRFTQQEQKPHKIILNSFLSSKRADQSINKKFNHIKTTINHQDMILKTLQELKQIQKENLLINKQILKAMVQRKVINPSTLKKKNKQSQKYSDNKIEYLNLNTKSTVKKSFDRNNQQSVNNHQISINTTNQTKQKFYLYEKPVKSSSINKIELSRSLGKIKNSSNMTKLSNITKMSLGNNTTKLSLNRNKTKLCLNKQNKCLDKLNKELQKSKKFRSHHDSKSSIKKNKETFKKGELGIEQKIKHKLSQKDKMRSSFNRQNDQKSFENLNRKTQKKKSKSQSMIRG